VSVTGGNYPPPPEKQKLATLFGFLQMIFFVLLMMGDTLCQAIGIPVPNFIKKIQESKVMYGIVGFLLGNMI